MKGEIEKMTSKELKKMFKDEGIYMWQIAQILKIHEVTFGKWFRENRLSQDRERLVLAAVEQIKQERLTKEQQD